MRLVMNLNGQNSVEMTLNRVYNGVYSVTGETDERISDLCC